MRTPVLLVGGQGDTDAVVGVLMHARGTLVVEHRFDGQVVRRTMSARHGYRRTGGEVSSPVRFAIRSPRIGRDRGPAPRNARSP